MRYIIISSYFFVTTFFSIFSSAIAEENSLQIKIQGIWCGNCIQNEPCIYEFTKISEPKTCPKNSISFSYSTKKGEDTFTHIKNKKVEEKMFFLEVIDEANFRITFEETKEMFLPIFEGTLKENGKMYGIG